MRSPGHRIDDQGLAGWGEAFGFRTVSPAKLAIDELIVRCALAGTQAQSCLACDIQKSRISSRAKLFQSLSTAGQGFELIVKPLQIAAVQPAH
jgi:hypothetical protein